MAWMVRSFDNNEGKLVHSYFASTDHGLAPVVTYRLFLRMDPVLYPAMDYAARIGDFALLQRLHHDGNVRWPCTTRGMDAAAKRGDMDMGKWLYANREEGCTHKAMDGAARQGHFETVTKLYYILLVTGSDTASDDAAAAGHLRILKWQATRFVRFKVSTEALEEAAGAGHLHVLQWIDESQKPVQLTPEMVHNVANGGHFDVLKWLLKKVQDPRVFLQSHFISRGASSGNVEMMQWLWSEYGLLSAEALHHALVSGSRPMVDWLLEVVRGEDRRLRVDTLYEMARREHWTLLEWLLQTHVELCTGCDLFPCGLFRNTRPQMDGSTPASFQDSYILLMIRYCPSACLREPQLPAWAAYHGRVDLLRTLQRLCHHQALDTGLVPILTTTVASVEAADLVMAIVAEHPECARRSVVQWAAAYGHVGLLDQILRTATREPLAVIRIALFTACRHGRMRVLNWVPRNASVVGGDYDVWSGAVQVAARHRQAQVSELLQTMDSLQKCWQMAHVAGDSYPV